MGQASWQKVGRAAPAELSNVRIQSHHAIQWLSRVARAILPEEDDEDGSNGNLGWSHSLGGLVTHSFDDQCLQVGFRFADAKLVLMEQDSRDETKMRVFEERSVHGQSDADIGNWLVSKSGLLRFDPADLHADFPYPDFPHHPLQDGARYALDPKDGRLAELGRWFANGASLLDEIVEKYKDRVPGPTRPRIWPHHFDVGMLIFMEQRSMRESRVLSLGLSPGDDLYAEPYFYLAHYPLPRRETLPDLPRPGTWQADQQFTGAILRGNDLVRTGDPAKTASHFMDTAIKAFL